MKTAGLDRARCCFWIAFHLAFQLLLGKQASAQIRYSVPEEVEDGTVVGNVLHAARDTDAGANSIRTYTLTPNEHFDIEISDEEKIPFLLLKKSLDREQKNKHVLFVTAVDGGRPQRTGTLNVTVIVLDTNDNRPTFSQEIYQVEIQENASVGTRVARVNATDPDQGPNGQIEYSLSKMLPRKVYDIFDLDISSGEIKLKGGLDFEESDTYKLDIQASDKGQPPLIGRCRLIIKIKDVNDNAPEIDVKSLSESISEDSKLGTVVALIKNMYSFSAHLLFVTAVDGGKPPRSGMLNVTITVLDINDNRPTFMQDTYQFEIYENTPVGNIIGKVDAIDPDEGISGEVKYSLGKTLLRKVYETFELDSESGQIKLKGSLDFEESEMYKIDVEATDKGTPPLIGRCKVVIKIKDINDNDPEIDVTSFSNSVPEDSKPGTVIALISVTDRDSGINGKVIAHINNNVPFELKPSYKENIYSLVTKGNLDREEISYYDIVIQAKDCGILPLSAVKTLKIEISDVNDNSQLFDQNPLDFYLMENNVVGKAILTLSAFDSDKNENAVISFHIDRGRSENDAGSFLNINSENGQVSALKSFDFESVKTFQFHVVATDSGSPPLSSNVTVNVFILDQNDNAPVILYPVSSNGSAEGQVTDHSLFALDRYTGQIRTLRSFTETDEAEHKLLILVKDNGNVSLSATATVIVKLVEPKEAFAASDVQSAAAEDEDSHVTFYLIITLGSVSLLFLISIIVLIAMQCSNKGFRNRSERDEEEGISNYARPDRITV
uniref:Si:ch73-379j16.2 n=1 Tax=Oryzias melastigma TaxID=30732 RepID=A0A3B3BBE3_ORYME